MIHWKSFAEFVEMGGYALYVWGSYGVTALIVAGELVALRLRRRHAQEQVRQWQALQGEIDDTAS